MNHDVNNIIRLISKTQTDIVDLVNNPKFNPTNNDIIDAKEALNTLKLFTELIATNSFNEQELIDIALDVLNTANNIFNKLKLLINENMKKSELKQLITEIILKEENNKIQLVINAIKQVHSAGGDFVEKWLDKNSKKLDMNKIKTLADAISEVERISKRK